MPTPNPSIRREYKGAAAASTLNGGIGATSTSFVINSNTNWPTGAVGDFTVTIDRGLATEERILCSAQSSKTVTVATRGYDGTTAQAHANLATVECTLSGVEADEWNQHTNAVSGVHGVAGSVVGTTDTQTLSNKSLSSAVLDAASTIGGVSGTSLAADRTAWTTWSVLGWTNITVGNSAVVASYKQLGKLVWFRLQFTGGSTSGTNGSDITWTPPVTPSTTADQWTAATAFTGAVRYPALCRIATTNVMEVWVPTSTSGSALSAWTGAIAGSVYATGFAFTVEGVYEAA